MLKFAVRRLLLLVPILLGLSILVFLFVRALPGGPETALLGERLTPERAAAVRAAYGLDRPVHEQYVSYMGKVARFDLGVSIQTQRPVSEEIGRRFPATVELATMAMLFALVVGIPLGFVAGRRPGSWIDNASTVGSLLGIAIPVFALGFLLKYLFAVRLGWLPTDGRQDVTLTTEHPTGFFVLDGVLTGDLPAAWDALKHLVLPAIALGTIPLAIITRITRAAVQETINEDFVRTAEAKGMTKSIVTRRHILRNAMLPVVTIVGLQTGLLLSGAILTETVFAFGGMGSFMASALFSRDFPVIQGGILFLAVVFVVVNLIVDISYGFIDPRVRAS
ncbi:MAG: peptide transporter permease [Frankiales bacterium]|nr:peptide transporter permease [Frankiales bacterium]